MAQRVIGPLGTGVDKTWFPDVVDRFPANAVVAADPADLDAQQNGAYSSGEMPHNVESTSACEHPQRRLKGADVDGSAPAVSRPLSAAGHW